MIQNHSVKIKTVLTRRNKELTEIFGIDGKKIRKRLIKLRDKGLLYIKISDKCNNFDGLLGCCCESE